MNTAEVIKSLQPWIERQRRVAWKPSVAAGDGEPTTSKFCGTPWTGRDAPWPECGVCKQPLRLFVQLNLDDLPPELGAPFGSGLLQLFYCCQDGCQGMGGWEPFADDVSRVRVVKPNGASSPAPAPVLDGQFPAKVIVGWEPLADLPSTEEQRELGLNYAFDFRAKTIRLECPELGLVVEDLPDMGLPEKISTAKAGDKLGGWPCWIQGVEYPNCPRCGRRMQLLFQLDSEQNVPFMFGDCGIGHITQCPEHKDVVAFGWACC